MRKFLLTAAAAAVALATVPAASQAATYCEAKKHNDKVAGTVIGGIAGAILGSQVAGHGAKTEGSVLGAGIGAVAGNQLARSKTPCPDGYSYRDDGRPDPYGNRGWYDSAGGYHYYDGAYTGESRDTSYSSSCRWQRQSYYDDYGRRVDRDVRICR